MPTTELMELLPVSSARFRPDWGQETSGQGNGVIRVKHLRPTLWRAGVTCAAMTHLEARQALALLGDIVEVGGTFYLWKPVAAYPQADPGGTFLGASAVKINSLNADNRRLSLKGFPATLGPELVAAQNDGSGTNWAFDAGNAEWDHAAGNTTQLTINIPDLEAGSIYRLAWTMRNRTAGSVTPRLGGGGAVHGTLQAANGSYIDDLTALAGNTNLVFAPTTDFNGSVALMSLKKVLARYQLTRGDFLAFDYGAGPSRALHQVVPATVFANSSGVTSEFIVTPHIRPGALVNLDVILVKPSAEMMLVPGSYNPDERAATAGLTFDAVQVL